RSIQVERGRPATNPPKLCLVMINPPPGGEAEFWNCERHNCRACRACTREVRTREMLADALLRHPRLESRSWGRSRRRRANLDQKFCNHATSDRPREKFVL